MQWIHGSGISITWSELFKKKTTGVDFAPHLHFGEHFPGERCTPTVAKAGELVQVFLGTPASMGRCDADVGASAHRGRSFWTNMLSLVVLQAALPTLLPPSSSLDFLLNSYHIPTKPGHTDQFPFATHHQLGWAQMCVPTVVSFFLSNVYRPKENGNPGEGQVFNIIMEV